MVTGDFSISHALLVFDFGLPMGQATRRLTLGNPLRPTTDSSGLDRLRQHLHT